MKVKDSCKISVLTACEAVSLASPWPPSWLTSELVSSRISRVACILRVRVSGPGERGLVVSSVALWSNQSALWSCLLSVTSQLGEGCGTSFVHFVFLIQRKTVLERFPRWVFGEFYRSAKYVRNFPRSTHMFICWRARKPRTRMKAQASCSNKEFDKGQ